LRRFNAPCFASPSVLKPHTIAVYLLPLSCPSFSPAFSASLTLQFYPANLSVSHRAYGFLRRLPVFFFCSCARCRGWCLDGLFSRSSHNPVIGLLRFHGWSHSFPYISTHRGSEPIVPFRIRPHSPLFFCQARLSVC